MAYLLAALLGALLPGPVAEFPESPATTEIRLLVGPIHYDILLPATPETRAAFGFAAAAGVPVDAPGAEWIVVGWGAREFYTTAGTYADVTASAVLRAIIGDRSVLRVDAFGALPDHADLPAIALREDQLAHLITLIRAELAHPEPIPDAGFTPADAFFPANSPFSALYPCNQWVGEVLRGAGVPMGRWTPTPYAITLSLRLHAR